MGKVNGNHVNATQYSTGCIVIGRIARHQGDGAKANDDDQRIADADETGGIKNALARGFNVTDGEKPHENVWKTCRTEDQCQPQGNGGYRIGNQTAGAHDCPMGRMNLNGLS